MHIDWDGMYEDWLRGTKDIDGNLINWTYATISKKYRASAATVAKHAMEEGWQEKREALKNKIMVKATDVASELVVQSFINFDKSLMGLTNDQLELLITLETVNKKRKKPVDLRDMKLKVEIMKVLQEIAHKCLKDDPDTLKGEVTPQLEKNLKIMFNVIYNGGQITEVPTRISQDSQDSIKDNKDDIYDSETGWENGQEPGSEESV